jgi:hypothetical protein
MSCKTCHSENQREYSSEINLLSPKIGDLAKPSVWVFPSVLICLDCGSAEFKIPSPELVQLRNERSSK